MTSPSPSMLHQLPLRGRRPPASPLLPFLEGRTPASPHPRSPSLSGGTSSRESAFTLLELLLAVAIFAVVLLAIHTVFYSALNLRNRTTAQIEASIPLQHALEIIKRDLSNLVPPGGTFSGPFQSVSTAGVGFGPASATSSNVYRAVLPGTVVSPELHTTTGIVSDQLPWGEITRVTYYLADPTNNSPGRDLMRSVTRNLLPVVQDQPENQWLLGGVTDFAFLFFDGLQWVNFWDSTTAATPLPSALKIQIHLTSLVPARERSHPIELVVPLQVQSITNQIDQTDSETGGSS